MFTSRPLTQEEIKRLVAIEREQMRQREEQARQAQELIRHEAWLKKHDKEIAELRFKLEQAESDIEHWKEQIGNLYGLLDLEKAMQAKALPGSKADYQSQKRIITLSNQIHAAESRLAKAKHTKAATEKELAA